MSKRRIYLYGITLSLLFIPFISMFFSSEVNWDLEDFALMGILLFGVALLFDLVFITIKRKITRILFYVFFLLCFLTTWIQLAVGIF